MAVEVYYWSEGLLDTGHAAMKVDGGIPSGTVYLSQYPGSKRSILLWGPAWSARYDDEVKTKGKPKVVRITHLDETNIKKFINAAHTVNAYSFLAFNCSTQVKMCLDAGLTSTRSGQVALLLTQPGLMSPTSVYYYAKIIQSRIG